MLTPSIKGIFVNSHISAVRAKKGEAGVLQLEKLYGKPIKFKNNDLVPIREEVKIIECALDVLAQKPIPENKKKFEAGRLHFTNFSQTPFAKILFSLFKTNFKLMMLQSPNIAGHVFEGVKFSALDVGPKSVLVTMEHIDYPIEHFQGLFQAWMDFAGLYGTITANRKTNPDRFEYMMRWD